MHEGFESMQMRAWPAEREAWLGSWRLRFSRGFSNRSNSAYPMGGMAREADPARVLEAETVYRSESIRPCFRLRDDAECAALDAYLGNRGYETIHPTLVKRARLGESALLLRSGRLPEAPVEPRVEEGFTRAWAETYASLNGRSEDAERYGDTLVAVAVPVRALTLFYDGEPVAAGSVIFDTTGETSSPGLWAGFYDLAVAPRARGGGYGRRLLLALVEEALACGAELGYLAVMESNPAARGLYASAGFVDLYRYWYRKAPS